MSLRRRLAIALTVGGVALVLIVALATTALVRLSQAQTQLVERVQVARVASLDLQVALFDQQAAARGHVISGDPELLEVYEAARANEAAARSTLIESKRDDELVMASLDALQERSESWRTTLVEPALDLVAAGRTDEALAALTDPAATSFDSVAEAGRELGASLTQRRTEAVEQADRAIGFLHIVSAVVLALVVAGGVLLVVALRRHVIAPLEVLGGEARTVASGDFEHAVAEHGPAEIRYLARDVEGMRWQILSELRQADQARQESVQHAADLERSNRDLEQFAYVASHDLQEPLRKVAGFCQLLERRYSDELDERGREYVHYAVDGAQRMQVLINDLLTFSRVGRTTDEFEPVDLATKVRRAWNDVGADDDATLDVAGDLPTIAGDPALLRTLFVNLFANAIKFRSEADPMIRVSAEQVDDQWEITVQDNGIGIDPQFADRIFDIFQRLHTRETYDGTGIGLAICKRIAEFHGGSIRLAPSDEGARFVVSVPVHDDRSDIAPLPAPRITPVLHPPTEGSST